MRKMLTPHVRAIGRPAGPAQDDAVDPASVEGTPAALKNDLIRLVPGLVAQGAEAVELMLAPALAAAAQAFPGTPQT